MSLHGAARNGDQSANARNASPLDPEGLITRFIVERSKIAGNHAHWRAFLPSKRLILEIEVLETSVSDISQIDEAEILDIGQHVAAERKLELVARADLTVKQASDPPLKVQRDEDPKWHAVIRGWGDKDMQKAYAMELAARSNLRRY